MSKMVDACSTFPAESGRRELAHLVVVAAAVVALLTPWLLNRDLVIVSPTELGTDLVTKQWPNAKYIVQNWQRHGEIPLWHTAGLGGVPIVGNPSMLLAYPPYWLIFVCPISWAFTVYFALHLTWAGWGAYHLARRVLQVSPAAGLLSGLTFGLSAKMLAHIGGGHLDILAAVAWLPWLWWAIDGLGRRASWLAIGGAGAAIAAQALTHLPTLWLSALVVGSWGLWTQLANRGAGTLRRWVRLGLGGVATLALAMGLSAVHVWPMLELLPFSTRSGMTLTEASHYALPVPLLIGLVLPTALAFPEWVVYAGVVTLNLAPASALAHEQNRAWWFLLALVAVGTVLSLGRATPLYALLFRLLPGMSWFRIPTRMMFPVQLALALLAGMGWDASKGLRFRRRRALVAWWSVLAVTLIVGAAWTRLFPNPLAVPFVSAAIAIAALVVLTRQSRVMGADSYGPVILAALVVVEAAALAPHFLAQAQSANLMTDTPEVEFLKTRPGPFRTYSTRGLVSLTEAVVHGLETADGNDPFQFDHYVEWMNAASGCDLDSYAISVPACAGNEVTPRAYLQAQPDGSLLGLGNVQYVIADHAVRRWQSVVWQSDGLRIYENPKALPRAYVVPEIVTTEHNSIALALLHKRGPEGMATIARAPEEGWAGGTSYHPAELVRRTPDCVELQVDGPGWLVLSEVWAPGWRASVDGIETEVYRTDVAFCGLPLSEGRHRVTLKYAPVGWLWGRWVSLGTAMITLAGTVIGVWRWRRRRTRE